MPVPICTAGGRYRPLPPLVSQSRITYFLPHSARQRWKSTTTSRGHSTLSPHAEQANNSASGVSQRFGTRRFTILDLRFTIYDLKVSGLRRYTRKQTLTADGGASDTPTRFFTQNTMPLCRLWLFFHNLWGHMCHFNTCIPKITGNWHQTTYRHHVLRLSAKTRLPGIRRHLLIFSFVNRKSKIVNHIRGFLQF